MYQPLNRASHVPSAARDHGPRKGWDAKFAWLRLIVFQRCNDRSLTLAEKRSPTVFEKIAQLKWNQYLALMRRDGEYGPIDLNADLTAPILPSADSGTQLNYEQELKDDLDNTIQILQVRSPTNVDTVRKSLGVESFVKQLSHVVQRSIAVRQRQGNRKDGDIEAETIFEDLQKGENGEDPEEPEFEDGYENEVWVKVGLGSGSAISDPGLTRANPYIWAALIKEQLAPQYGTVAAERGRGIFGRMKLNMTFIRDSAHTVFELLNAGTRIAFAGSVGEVQSELFDGIKRILREISLFFISENSLSMRKWWTLSDALQDSTPCQETWRALLY
ncbi:hypothetical protein B0H13DRAFT_1867123 [Mycena leptocephala]|nr:hypothetical protein B0H13DRAFT_1867123 [Mycena leptocephala]